MALIGIIAMPAPRTISLEHVLSTTTHFKYGNALILRSSLRCFTLLYCYPMSAEEDPMLAAFRVSREGERCLFVGHTSRHLSLVGYVLGDPRLAIRLGGSRFWYSGV